MLLRERRFVIDGTNIILLHGRAHPELRYLVALCTYIDDNGGEFECFFDANTRYILADHRPDQLEAFDRISSEAPWSTRLHSVASGTEADAAILMRAKRDGSEVISNDKFRNRARKNPWIWKRRHPVQVSEGRLILPTLNTAITVLD